MNRPALTLLLLAALLTGAVSCIDTEPDNEDFDRLIEEEVERKLAKWAEVKWRKCEEALQIEASLIVDSLVLEEARRGSGPAGKPSRPRKPGHPDPINFPDSLALEPIFPRDSVGR